MDTRVSDLRFLKESCNIDILLECTRQAVELFFEGGGIPPLSTQEEPKKKRGSVVYAELDTQTTSSLIEYLSYRDEVIQEQSLMLIIKRASTDSTEIREKGGIRAIVNLLLSPTATLQHHAAKAVYLLSQDDKNKDAIRNVGAIPDILVVLTATESDRLKAMIVTTLLNLIRCERNLPAIRAAGGITASLHLFDSKALPLQVAAAQLTAFFSSTADQQYAIAKAGGMSKLYRAMNAEPVLQKEALKVITFFSKTDKGKEIILLTSGVKYLLRLLKPERILEVPSSSVRNSHMRRTMTKDGLLGRVRAPTVHGNRFTVRKTNAFKKQEDTKAPLLGWHKNDEPSGKDETVYHITLQQLILAVFVNLSSSERCRKGLCELGTLPLLVQYLANTTVVPPEMLQLVLKVLFSLTTVAQANPVFSSQQNPLGRNCINMLLQLTSVKITAAQYLVVSILDNLSKLPQYQEEIGVGVPTLLRLLNIVEPAVKKIILKVVAALSNDDLVKKVIFDGGGIPILIRMLTLGESDVFPRVVQLLGMLIVYAPMRKAVILAGGITQFVNLVSITTDEKNQLVYLETLAKVVVDDDGVASIFNTPNAPQTLVGLLYSSSAKVRAMAVSTLSNLLLNDSYKLKFEEIGGVHAALSLLKDKDLIVTVEALKIITKLLHNARVRKLLMDSGLVIALKELGKHDNLVKVDPESDIVKAMRNLVVAIKVNQSPQSSLPPTPPPKVPSVWLKCKLGQYARMVKVTTNTKISELEKLVCQTYVKDKVTLAFIHGNDEVSLRSDEELAFVLEQALNAQTLEILVYEKVDPLPVVVSTPEPEQKNTSSSSDTTHIPEMTGLNQYKPHINAPVEPRQPLPLSQVLDYILRPLREDEIWAVAYQSSKILYSLHIQKKVHKGIRQDVIIIDLEGKIELISGPFILDQCLAPESTSPAECTPKSDIYGLGASLWTSADFLLEEDEEPDMGPDLCALIEQMTDDDPTQRPSAEMVMMESEKYQPTSANILRELLSEVERKKLLRREYDTQVVEKQVDLSRKLLQEIRGGIKLKPVKKRQTPPPSFTSSLLKEIKSGKQLKHVDVGEVKNKSPLRDSFIKDLKSNSDKRTITILDQSVTEGKRLWGRDVLRWNEEVQKIFNWNINMVRIVLKLTATMEDRMNFLEHMSMLALPVKNQLANTSRGSVAVQHPTTVSPGFSRPSLTSGSEISPSTAKTIRNPTQTKRSMQSASMIEGLALSTSPALDRSNRTNSWRGAAPSTPPGPSIIRSFSSPMNIDKMQDRIATHKTDSSNGTKAQADEQTQTLFATHLLRMGFNVKMKRYIQLSKEIVDYEEIFRPQDLPLPLFLKAILIALHAKHLIPFYERASGERLPARTLGKWSFLKQ